jgi:signal transduction histidine kinase
MPGARLAELLSLVAYERNADTALDKLTRAAVDLTKSRNAMLARMNDELGCLELTNGVGEEWQLACGEPLQVSVSTREGIVAYVAATGETYTSGNVQQEPRYRNLFGTTVSEIAVPIRDQYRRIRAVLNVESDLPNAYGTEAEELCEQIALLIALVLEREESSTRERALLEVSHALDQAWTEEELIAGVIRVASEVLRFQAFSLFLLDMRTESFVLRGSVGRLKEMVGKIRYKSGEGCTGWVAETGKPILLESPQTDSRWRGLHVEFPSEQIASFLAVPVLWRGKAVGVLRAIRRVTENQFLDNRFTDSDQQLLEAIADHLASVLQGIRSVQKMVHSERMVAWGELSAKSSHMIGNRVFALKGDVNELGFLLKEPTSNQEALQEVQKNLSIGVTRIEEILQEFRDFLTATQLDKEPLDLNEFVESTVREVFPKRIDVTLDLRLAADLPQIEADRKKLTRAVSELVENALNYVSKGVVIVETGIASSEEARTANLSQSRKYAKIAVEDSGPGVEPDQKAVIFQPFFSSRVKGMGLGLSIVKGIVDAHGGGIFEGGEQGRGAKFVILLPLPERSNSETL